MTLAKLKVDQLRTELRNRNLTTSGTKPILLSRLQEAIAAEEAAAADTTDAATTVAPEKSSVVSDPPAVVAPSEKNFNLTPRTIARPDDETASKAPTGSNGEPARNSDGKPAALLRNFKDMTDEERIAARKARFGGTCEGMLLARAMRFGNGNKVTDANSEKRKIEGGTPLSAEAAEELARREKRAKRFAS